MEDNQDNTEYTKVRLIINTDEFSMEYDYPCPSYIIIKDEGMSRENGK